MAPTNAVLNASSHRLDVHRPVARGGTGSDSGGSPAPAGGEIPSCDCDSEMFDEPSEDPSEGPSKGLRRGCEGWAVPFFARLASALFFPPSDEACFKRSAFSRSSTSRPWLTVAPSTSKTQPIASQISGQRSKGTFAIRASRRGSFGRTPSERQDVISKSM